MDNLTYAYSGNRLTKVTDAVTTAITNPDAFHFVDGANVINEYTYDANGNITKDLNKKIASITYNSLNLPSAMTFSGGNTTTYGYDASGSKLSVAYKSGGTTAKTEYVGNKVYKNGTLGMILTEEGYITLTGTTPTYYYYLKDHQGNNRVVLNQGGAVQQVNHYYPFGGIFGEGLQSSKQPYKYNGKELDRQWGLDMYDYGARHYDTALGRWFTMDPLAEKYYPISPYVYVVNNPVRFIDPFGMDYWSTNNPELINRFLSTIRWDKNININRNPIEHFDFKSWDHASDAEFTGNLTYNNETKTFHSSYGVVENGIFVKIGISIKANEYNGSASIPNQHAIDWWKRSSGAVN